MAEPGHHERALTDDLRFSDAPAARVGMRAYFSRYFRSAASHLSDLAGEIEAKHTGGPVFSDEHRTYVLGSVIAAAAFLEAMINELYWDAVENYATIGEGYIAPLSVSTRRIMSELWKSTSEGRRLSPLGKYQLALVAGGREPIDEGAQTFQDAKLLVSMRNTLLHYQPTLLWSDEVSEMQRRFKGKFPDNRLMQGSPGNPWWPDHCLGHGCAEWAARSAVNLADQFCAVLGIMPNYQR